MNSSMTDILIVYLIFAVIGLSLVIMTLPTIIARRKGEHKK